MPIKKDGTGKRWVEMEVLVPGTPEQVWQALATGPGSTAWFVNTTIDERVGGALKFDFGPLGSSAGEVTAYEPPRQFEYIERNWSPGAPPVATEITITSRSGDQCIVRMVHSMFSTSDEWDDQLEGFEKGWPAFFEVLRIYMTHFRGRPAASFVIMTNTKGDHLTIWKRLTDQLALSGANAGERWTTASQPEKLSGVIERVQQQNHERVVFMRLDTPTPGIAMLGTCGTGPQVTVSVNVYLYGDDAATRAKASEQKWQAWVSERCAPAESPVGSSPQPA